MDTPGNTTGGVTATRFAASSRTARTAVALVAALVAGLLGGLGDPATGAAPALGGDLTRVVVQARQDLGAVAAAVARQGGEVVDVLSSFGMVVADVPADRMAPLRADDATGAVTPDQPMTVQSLDDEDGASGPAVAGTDAVDPSAGEGVGVVLVDTGIDHDSLEDDVVARYDLSPSQKRDGHGHGTFMAGIVDQQAPASHLVSVQVADDDGSTTLTRVLHGLAIADAARERHDAPVVLLAMAGDPGDAPDPIMTTLEMLWARGSTVVVPSGNRGPDQVTSPGTDPYLITVGADGADWSGSGTVFGKAKPEILAPGVDVEGLLVEGSTIAREREANGGDPQAPLTGSGTSMAAAHVAGLAATTLASADAPMSPDAVKTALVGEDADNSELPALPEPAGPDRGSQRFLNPGAMRRSANDLQPQGWSWTGWSWTGWSWTGWSWTSRDAAGEADWAGWSWTGDDWAGWSWTGWSWTGWSWTGWSWTGWSWTGWSWTGWSWTAAEWGDGTT